MVTLRISGKVHHRIKYEGGTNDDITVYNKEMMRFETEFNDPIEFNKSLRTSPHSMINKLMPSGYSALNTEEYRMTVDFNVSEAIEWAEKAAEYREEDTKLDILLFWLQLFGSTRIRKAVHTVLQNKGIDTNEKL